MPDKEGGKEMQDSLGWPWLSWSDDATEHGRLTPGPDSLWLARDTVQSLQRIDIIGIAAQMSIGVKWQAQLTLRLFHHRQGSRILAE